MKQTYNVEELKKRRQEIHTKISGISDLRPGSLVGRYRKCGKPNCHCADEHSPGHGPSWSLTRKVKGKTVTTIIPAHAVEQTKKQIAEYRCLRELTGELVEVSEKLCDAMLVDTAPLAGETGKKRALKKVSKKRLVPK